MADTPPEPAPAPAPSRVVTVVDPSGQRFDVPQDQLGAALQDPTAGFHVESPEERQKREFEEKYGTAGQQVKTGAEAVAHGATLGLSTPVEVALGIADPEDILARQAVNPTLYTAGQIAGGLAMAAATSGIGAGATAATRGAQAAAAAAKPLLTRAALAAGKEALVGGGWGLASGLGEVAREAALGNPNLTAQNVFEQVGMSTLLGGGLGGALGATGQLLPAALSKSRDVLTNVYGRGKGAAVEAMGAAPIITGSEGAAARTILENPVAVEALEQRIPGIADHLKTATPEMAEWAAKNTEKLAAYEQAFPGAAKNLMRAGSDTADYLTTNFERMVTDPKRRAAMPKEMAEGLQDVIGTSEGLMRRINKEFIPGEEEALLRPLQDSNIGKAKSAYEGLTQRVDDLAAEMRGKKDIYKSAHARTLEDIGEGLKRDATDDIVDGYRRMKTLKQQLDESIIRKPVSSIEDVTERNAQIKLRDLRKEVNDTLKNPDIWGQTAARRSALDDVQHQWLKATGKKSAFRNSFMRETPGGVWQVNRTKVNTFINNAAKDSGAEAAEAIGQVMDLAKQMLKETEESAVHAPATTFDKKAAADLLTKSGQQATDLMADAQVTAMHKQMMSGGMGIAGSGPVTPGLGRALVGQGLEMLSDVFLPGGVKTALRLATKVGKGTAVLSQLEKMGQTAGRHIDNLADGIVSGRLQLPRGVSVAAEAVAPAQIRELSGNPELLQQHLEKLGANGVYEHAPETTAALQMHMARSVTYLASKLPPATKTGPMGYELEPGPGQMAAYNRVAPVVQQPTTVLQHVSSGTLTLDMVEAAEMTAPEILQAMRASVLDKIAARGPNAAPLPYKTQLGLSTLFRQSLDGSSTGKAIMANQMPYQMGSQKGPESQGMKPITPSQEGASKLKVSNRWATSGTMSTMRLREG